jgi:triosephosphate isomerase
MPTVRPGGRRKLIAGNWKSHKTLSAALAWVHAVHELDLSKVDAMVFPAYTALATVHQALGSAAAGFPHTLQVGAQDLYYHDGGAYTGAVGATLLRDAGATAVLVGHSERRQHFGETLQSSHLRVQAALHGGLQPVVCVGETVAERRAGHTEQVVLGQLEAALQGLSPLQVARLVVAYEPIWAIGSGQVATGAQAQEVHSLLRQRLRALCTQQGIDAALALNVRLLYGGSVKPSNAAELLAQPDIDGALVGGASLSADSFVEIIRLAAAA